MDNELNKITQEVKEAAVVETLKHDQFIIKCLAVILALSISLNALIIGGIGYIFYNYDLTFDTYGDVSNSVNVGNKQTANEMNIYNGDK